MEDYNPNEYRDTSNRIYNWRWAIFFMVFGFGLAALISAWLWNSWSGGEGLSTDLSATSELVTDIVLSIVLGFVVIVLVWVGFTAPVFWSEIGEKLVFRKIFGVQTRQWSDIKAMKFDEDEGADDAAAASPKRDSKKTLEITLFEDDAELAVTIPPSHYDRIVKLGAEHGFVLDGSEPDGGRTGEMAPGPSGVASESPEAAPEPPEDAAKPSGVTRVFEILTASPESASGTVKPTPRVVKRTSKAAKSKSKSSKSVSKSSKRTRKSSKRTSKSAKSASKPSKSSKKRRR